MWCVIRVFVVGTRPDTFPPSRRVSHVSACVADHVVYASYISVILMVVESPATFLDRPLLH